MQLIYSPTSPYARKVRMLVIEKGLTDRVEVVVANPLQDPPELLAANPLAKVPAIIVEPTSSPAAGRVSPCSTARCCAPISTVSVSRA